MKRMFFMLPVLAVCLASSVSAEEIKMGGGGAAIAEVFNPVKEAYQKASGDQLVIIQSASSKALVEMYKGNLDFASGAVSLENLIAGAAKEGVTIDKAALNVVTVATSRTVILLDKSNKVAKLSKDELKGIFTGKIVNWKDVGGEPGDIIVVWAKNTPGQNALFIKEILDGQAVTKEVLDATDYKNIKESVAGTPGSIGIDPFVLADSSVKMPEVPSLTTSILAITKGKPSAKVQRLYNYIAGEGKKYIK